MPEYCDGTFMVGWWTPDSRTRDLHGTESHAMNCERLGICSDGELTRGENWLSGHIHIQQGPRRSTQAGTTRGSGQQAQLAEMRSKAC